MKILTTLIGILLIISQLSCITVRPPYARTRSGSWEYRKALQYHGAGNLDRAIEAYTEEIQRKPNNINAIFSRGLAHAGQLHPTLATKDYTTAISQLSSDKPKIYPPDIYIARGINYALIKEHELAIKDYNEAIKFDPNHADAYHVRGLSYYSIKEYNLAISDYTKAITLNSTNAASTAEAAQPYQHRAITYFINNQIDKAIADLIKATELNQSDDTNYYNLAMLYDIKNDEAKSTDNLKIAIELNPSYINYEHNKTELIEYEQTDSYKEILYSLTLDRIEEELVKAHPENHRIRRSSDY